MDKLMLVLSLVMTLLAGFLGVANPGAASALTQLAGTTQTLAVQSADRSDDDDDGDTGGELALGAAGALSGPLTGALGDLGKDDPAAPGEASGAQDGESTVEQPPIPETPDAAVPEADPPPTVIGSMEQGPESGPAIENGRREASAYPLFDPDREVALAKRSAE